MKTDNKTLHQWFRGFFFSIAVSALSFGVYADTPRLTNVGVYDDQGDIQLNTDLFLREFPDGRPVKALSIVEKNGFLHVSRKGYDDDGTCFTELAQLVDRCGTPLVVGSDPFTGKRAFLSDVFPVRVVSCADDGCRVLNDISSEPLRAHCDITGASDGVCACHVTHVGSIKVSDDENLCQSFVVYIPYQPDEWTDGDDVSTGGTICPDE